MPHRAPVTSQERPLLFDMWRLSKLPAKDFGMLVGLASHTLHEWKRRFDEEGPAGLADRPRGSPPGSRLPEVTQRSILMLKQDNPDWGCQRISDMLAGGADLGASPSSVAQVLHDEGYELEDIPTRPHPDRVRGFERAAPNELWQTDLFTFMLKRQKRRVHLVAFMDDHSRYIVGYALHATASSLLVIEVLRAVFYDPETGTRWQTLRSQWLRARKRAGYPWLTPKHLRPTFATDLSERGLESHMIQDLLGHLSVAVTERFYLRRRQRAACRAALRVLEGRKAG